MEELKLKKGLVVGYEGVRMNLSTALSTRPAAMTTINPRLAWQPRLMSTDNGPGIRESLRRSSFFFHCFPGDLSLVVSNGAKVDRIRIDHRPFSKDSFSIGRPVSAYDFCCLRIPCKQGRAATWLICMQFLQLRSLGH